jgi:hypothetical protein
MLCSRCEVIVVYLLKVRGCLIIRLRWNVGRGGFLSLRGEGSGRMGGVVSIQRYGAKAAAQQAGMGGLV